jgi:glucose-6-phosphate isomerase
MSQFLLAQRLLKDRLGAEHREHMILTTDAEKGVLRQVVREEGYRSFVVPDGVGGRFSVLSAVGLVSSALVGIDVPGLLRGAAAMDERCRTTELFENPALLHAAVQFLLHTERAKPMAVTFAYSHRLRDMADWYAQLLAESLGKKHDKWFLLLGVDQPDHSVKIPAAYPRSEGIAYLGGRTLKELFQAERDGTRIALTEAGRPNAMLSMEMVDAHSIGQLIFMLELAVAVMGEHYDVDAFDQPGVEAGKIAAYALMGRSGYEERRRQIEEALPRRTRSV